MAVLELAGGVAAGFFDLDSSAITSGTEWASSLMLPSRPSAPSVVPPTKEAIF